MIKSLDQQLYMGLLEPVDRLCPFSGLVIVSTLEGVHEAVECGWTDEQLRVRRLTRALMAQSEIKNKGS